MSDGAPDTLPSAGPPPADLLLDQRQRWQCGERVRVETYLEQQPQLASDTELLLDLIYHEFLLREQQGETPQPEEYLQRFPHLADPLRLQFEMDRAMQAGGLLSSSSGRPTLRLDQAGDTPKPVELPALPGYQVLELIGRGGMGVVYKARQVALNRPFKNGLLLKGAYTWSKALNQVDDDGRAVVTWSQPSQFDRNYAYAGYDRTHMLQLGFVYELPFAKESTGVLPQIIKNWQINGIGSWLSGTPFTVAGDNGLLQ